MDNPVVKLRMITCLTIITVSYFAHEGLLTAMEVGLRCLSSFSTEVGRLLFFLLVVILILALALIRKRNQADCAG